MTNKWGLIKENYYFYIITIELKRRMRILISKHIKKIGLVLVGVCSLMLAGCGLGSEDRPFQNCWEGIFGTWSACMIRPIKKVSTTASSLA